MAVASPTASRSSDPRVLNVGHESDLVYSIDAEKGPNAIKDFYAVFDGNFFDRLVDRIWAQHSINNYRYSTETLLSSQFYDETDRDSRVLVSLTSSANNLASVATDFFSADRSSVVLGRSSSLVAKHGIGLDANDFLIAGRGDDFLEGFDGDDVIRGDDLSLFGGGGDDVMSGGPGADTFLGTPGELNNDTIVDLEIGDKISLIGESIDQDDVSFDGSTIKIQTKDSFVDIFGTEISLNAVVPAGASLLVLDEPTANGGSIIEVVTGGQDLAFVIDVTGSMRDDIDAVKSQSNTILDFVFDSDRGLEDSRVAVVGFDDTSTVFLPFTEQQSAEQRKTAAAAAINQVQIGRSGTENVFSALRRTLSGGAGQWRAEAVSRKIILFTDEPGDDHEVRPEVERLAMDVGVATPLPSGAEGEGFSVFETFVMPEGEDVGRDPIPVQIFTVAIGDDTDTIRILEEIANFSGGRALRANDSTEVVDAILEVINQPNFSISASSDALIEGNSATQTITFTVTRDFADREATVSLALSGTVDDNDIVSFPDSLTFSIGERSKSFDVQINGDGQFEPDETLSIQIAGVDIPAGIAGDTATVTIENDDPERPSTRIYVPSIVARPHVIPGDEIPTAIIFRATEDATMSVTPIGSASVTETIRILDGDLSQASQYVGGVASAEVTTGGLYAIIFEPQSTDRLYSVRSSAGSSSLSARVSTNIFQRTDTNADGETTALDALMVINQMRRSQVSGEGEFGSASTQTYLDVNADGNITALDALMVINQLRRVRSVGPEGEGESMFPLAQSLLTKIREVVTEDDFGLPVERVEKLISSMTTDSVADDLPIVAMSDDVHVREQASDAAILELSDRELVARI